MFTIRCLAPFAWLWLALPCLAGTVEMKVIGRVVPGPCTVTFSEHGELLFGVIPASTLNEDRSTPLDQRQIALRIDCTQPTGVALTITDERAGSMIPGLIGPGTSDQEAFGLGLSDQARIGNYYVRMPRPDLYVDNRQAQLLSSADGRKSWKRTGPAGELRRDRSFAWTWPDTRLPLQFKTLRAVLSVTPYITRSLDLPLSHDIELDGKASLELQYF